MSTLKEIDVLTHPMKGGMRIEEATRQDLIDVLTAVSRERDRYRHHLSRYEEMLDGARALYRKITS